MHPYTSWQIAILAGILFLITLSAAAMVVGSLLSLRQSRRRFEPVLDDWQFLLIGTGVFVAGATFVVGILLHNSHSTLYRGPMDPNGIQAWTYFSLVVGGFGFMVLGVVVRPLSSALRYLTLPSWRRR